MSAEIDKKDNPGVIMMPPLMLLLFLVAGIALEFVLPVSFLAPVAFGLQSLIGVVLIAAGVGTAAWGFRTFTAAGTNVPPNQPALKVVTSGPYKFTRNPMYLGMLMALAGAGLAFSIEWLILLWVPFLVALHIGVVKREEKYMEGKFGAEYSQFLTQTRRWI